MLPNRLVKASASLRRCPGAFFSTSCLRRPLAAPRSAANKAALPSLSSLAPRCRGYSDDSSEQNHIQLPPLTDDEPIIYPSVFKTFKGFFQLFFVIKPYLDMEFRMSDFLEGSQQAMSTVSKALAQEDYESLQGLVTDNVINTLRNKISSLNYEQKKLIAVEKEDIYALFPYQVGIMFDDDKAEQKFVEITVVYYTLRGFQEIKNEMQERTPMYIGSNPNLRKRTFVCNYRFIREFTKGVESSWTINNINHFMPDTV